MELFHANKQWANRPPDERFASIEELEQVTRAYAATAAEKRLAVRDLRAEAQNGELVLVGKANTPAQLTNWSFGQMCSRVGAPAAYLRILPATLAAQNVNHGLAKLDDDYVSKLLFHMNGGLLLRAITGEDYARIWNWEVAQRLVRLKQQYGFTEAVPDIRTTCPGCGGSGKVSDTQVSCMHCKGTGESLPALYASDHDMFAFVRNNSHVVREPGNPDGLQRGLIVGNSEVGAAALVMLRFYYREMCGNHIIWGARNVTEIRVRHVGDARNRWGAYEAEIRRYLDESAGEDEEKIARARTVRIAEDKDKVLDKLFGMRSLTLSRKALEGGYEAVVQDQDGDPRTVWGIVQGLTRYSQTLPHADARQEVDKAAGKIMDVNF